MFDNLWFRIYAKDNKCQRFDGSLSFNLKYRVSPRDMFKQRGLDGACCEYYMGEVCLITSWFGFMLGIINANDLKIVYLST